MRLGLPNFMQRTPAPTFPHVGGSIIQTAQPLQKLTMGGLNDRFWASMAEDPGSTTPVPSPQPGYRVGDERLIRVTPAAAEKVRSLLTKQGRASGVLRVQVIGGGCSGLQYKMDLQDQPANRDIVVESQGIKVVIDPKSALYVTGSELDYVDALQGAGFKVKNPNAATTCACGESFSA